MNISIKLKSNNPINPQFIEPIKTKSKDNLSKKFNLYIKFHPNL